MNTVTSLVTIVSLLLALSSAGSVAKPQSEVNSQAAIPITPSRIALNHNETLVRDTAPFK